MKRILSIDFARGLAIIAIVWFHAVDKLDYNSIILTSIAKSFPLPVLFMISGAILNRRLNASNFDGKFYQKSLFLRILVPFYSLGICFTVIDLLIPESMHHSYSFKDMISALLFEQTNVDKLPSSPLWFLFTLFILSYFIYIFTKKIPLSLPILLIIAVVLKLIPTFEGVHYFGIDAFADNFIFFICGYIFSPYILEENTHIIIFLVSLSLWILCLKYQELFAFSINFRKLFIGIASSITIFHCSYFAIRYFPKNFLQKLVTYCGVNSLFIFVLHSGTIFIFKQITIWMDLANSITGLFIVIIGCIIMSLLIGKLFSYNATLSKLLFGRVVLNIDK